MMYSPQLLSLLNLTDAQHDDLRIEMAAFEELVSLRNGRRT